MRRALLALAILCCCTPAAAPAAGRCGDNPWCDTTLSPDARADLLVPALSTLDKQMLLWGDDQYGVANPPGGFAHTGTNYAAGPVPPLYFSDGPVGPRQGSGATSMPAPLSLAASFDRRLAARAGGLIADEVRAKGNDVVFAPTVNIMRTPRGGRSFESYGEDPFLAGELDVAWIRAAQAHGVIADVKHFAANNQETDRMTIDEQIDERTLREIYLPQFEAAIKRGHAGTVMCAYNKVNGQFACENRHLLSDILRKEWGFKGFVLADYPAAHDTAASLLGGLDFEPFGVAYNPASTTLALAQGTVGQADLDAAVHRIVRTMFAFGVFDRDAYANDDSQIPVAQHAATAARIEQGGITLLKNRAHALPIDPAKVKTIALIGSAAGIFKSGGGSSNVTPLALVTPKDGILARAQQAGVQVNVVDTDDPAVAAAAAENADMAIVVGADTATEGADAPCIRISCTDDKDVLVVTTIPRLQGPRNTDAVISAVTRANPDSVVLLETSAPVLTPWRDTAAAIVEAWYPGESGGTAMARVLFGDVDPGGRLPATFPAREEDLGTSGDAATFPGVGGVVQYKEGILVGYRWFDQRQIAPAYPFGFGLSYTHFRYSKLRVRGNRVSAHVRNTGARRGVTVPQLYVGMPASTGEPPRQLKGFTKLRLRPGASHRVSFRLNRRSFAYWKDGWTVAPGCYSIWVGRSSRDLPLRARSPRGGGHC